MVSGELISMTKLRAAMPALVPRPIAWGTYTADSNVHFFLCDFVTMTDDLPDVNKLGEMLAELHHNNVSPNGKYGFEVPTYQGTIPQRVEWQDTWEKFFYHLIERIWDIEWESQGPDEELKRLTDAMKSKVIPRLLRPLETGGREIKPRLLHGDIWDGNTSQDADTDLPVIYDATSLYAHNESMIEECRFSQMAKLIDYSGDGSMETNPTSHGQAIRKVLHEALPNLATRGRF
jgi:protein-ribulosamine 3-kinase